MRRGRGTLAPMIVLSWTAQAVNSQQRIEQGPASLRVVPEGGVDDARASTIHAHGTAWLADKPVCVGGVRTAPKPLLN